MKNIATPANSEMHPVWDMVDHVMGGTRMMRLAGERYLRRWEGESLTDYDNRLACATLLPAYRMTIENLVGRVFCNPARVNDASAKMQALTENMDDQGSNLNVFAARYFERALTYGVYFALVDQTYVQGLMTQADRVAAGARAYVTLYHPRQVLGFRYEKQRLVQLRLMESVEVPDGEYHAKNIEQVRLLEPGRWSTWRKREDTWVLWDEGPSATQEIAFVPLYTHQTGLMRAEPPMLDLLYLNVKHWNEQSDQDISTRFARVRMGFIIGLDDSHAIKLAADSFTRLPIGADVKVVQGSAESVSVGRESLDALVQQMREAGAKLTRSETQAIKTAAQSMEDALNETSALSRMAKALEGALNAILAFMAEIEGERAPVAVVNGEYTIDQAPEQTLDVLTRMEAQGIIAKRTVYEESQRRGVIADARTWEEEADLVAEQAPPLSAVSDADLPPDETQEAIAALRMVA